MAKYQLYGSLGPQEIARDERGVTLEYTNPVFTRIRKVSVYSSNPVLTALTQWFYSHAMFTGDNWVKINLNLNKIQLEPALEAS